jgi:hypothetical protein
MTIVTALFADGILATGHNDGTSIGDTSLPISESKWVSFGDWMLGISGESAAQAALEHDAGKIDAGTTDPFALCGMLKQRLVDNGIWRKPKRDSVMSFGIFCVLAHRSGLVWDVDNKFTLTAVPEGTLCARGSGMDFALGAAHALRQMRDMPGAEEQVGIATEAAVAHDVYCPGKAVITVVRY